MSQERLIHEAITPIVKYCGFLHCTSAAIVTHCVISATVPPLIYLHFPLRILCNPRLVPPACSQDFVFRQKRHNILVLRPCTAFPPFVAPPRFFSVSLLHDFLNGSMVSYKDPPVLALDLVSVLP